jgi:hypothetical protein
LRVRREICSEEEEGGREVERRRRGEVERMRRDRVYFRHLLENH